MGASERTGQTGKRQPYRCFLIRGRLEEGAGPNGTAAWRFTVQQADANAPRRTFVSLQRSRRTWKQNSHLACLLKDPPGQKKGERP